MLWVRSPPRAVTTDELLVCKLVHCSMFCTCPCLYITVSYVNIIKLKRIREALPS